MPNLILTVGEAAPEGIAERLRIRAIESCHRVGFDVIYMGHQQSVLIAEPYLKFGTHCKGCFEYVGLLANFNLNIYCYVIPPECAKYWMLK